MVEEENRKIELYTNAPTRTGKREDSNGPLRKGRLLDFGSL